MTRRERIMPWRLAVRVTGSLLILAGTVWTGLAILDDLFPGEPSDPPTYYTDWGSNDWNCFVQSQREVLPWIGLLLVTDTVMLAASWIGRHGRD